MDAVVLAAGKGTRMRTELPKVLHTAFGKPVLGYVLDTLAAAGIRKPLVVVGYKAGLVKSFLKNYDARPVLQTEQKGTGHAVMMTRSLLKGSKGPVLIWPGDMPLVETGTIERFVAANARSRAHASVLSSVVECPKGYGRIVREDGSCRDPRSWTLRTGTVPREVNTGFTFSTGSSFSGPRADRQ